MTPTPDALGASRMRSGLRAMCGLMAAVLLWQVLLVVAVGSAAAHSDLESSNPADDAAPRSIPATVVLRFNQNISADFTRVALTRLPDGRTVALNPRVDGPRVSAPVPTSTQPSDDGNEPGNGRLRWRVTYRVVSADGHPIGGTIDFTTPRLRSDPNGLHGGGKAAASSPASQPSVSGGSAGPSAGSAPAPTRSAAAGSGMVGTVVIGAITAMAALGVVAWLTRARARDRSSGDAGDDR